MNPGLQYTLRCGIVDTETGEVCGKPWHYSWPFCYDHGQEYRAYLDQCEGRLVALEAAAWARWRRTVTFDLF